MSHPQLAWGLQVLDRLELSGGERVLDAGCGTGRVTEELVRRLPRGHVVAVDISPAMIHEASHRLAEYGERVEVLQADLLRPLTTRPLFDAVFSTATFQWIRDQDTLFANLAAGIRPEGHLVAQWGGSGNIATIVSALELMGEPVDDTYFASPDETIHRLSGAGFCDITAWLNPEPTLFDTYEELEVYLEAIVLRQYVARRAQAQGKAFVRQVASRLPRPEIDYVRLNVAVRKQEDGRPSDNRGKIL